MKMRKLLALALCLCLALSLAPVSALALEDTDGQPLSQNIQTLVSLNIIQGKGDGKPVDPSGAVTRAEMAKMLCVALNGGDASNISSFINTPTGLTDITGHWAEGYIAYCVSLSILQGNGTGWFSPDTAVTGTEAAKMMLVALGYNSDIEGLVGASWALNTDSLANKVGIYNGLTGSVSAGLTLENAAGMMVQFLGAPTVKYEPEAESLAIPTGSTILEGRYKVEMVELGVMTGISYNAEGQLYSYTFTKYAETLSSGMDFSALFRMNCSAAFKTGGDVLSVIADDSAIVLSCRGWELKNTCGRFEPDAIAAQELDSSFKNAGDIPVYYFNAQTPAGTLESLWNSLYPLKLDFIDNTGDDRVDLAVAWPQSVCSVDSAKITTLYGEDVDPADAAGLASGFYAVTPAKYTAQGKAAAQPLEKYTGIFTGFANGRAAISGSGADALSLPYVYGLVGALTTKTESYAVLNGAVVWREYTSTGGSSDSAWSVAFLEEYIAPELDGGPALAVMKLADSTPLSFETEFSSMILDLPHSLAAYKTTAGAGTLSICTADMPASQIGMKETIAAPRGSSADTIYASFSFEEINSVSTPVITPAADPLRKILFAEDAVIYALDDGCTVLAPAELAGYYSVQNAYTNASGEIALALLSAMY